MQGYLFNIKMLRVAFDPSFTLHDIRADGPSAVTTRWTMAMRFTPAAALPTRKWWDPTIVFTGGRALGRQQAARDVAGGPRHAGPPKPKPHSPRL